MFWCYSRITFLIIWLSNLLTLIVPDEGHSRNVSCTLNLISTFVSLMFDIKWIKDTVNIERESCVQLHILYYTLVFKNT
jgi:uncharacterized protein YhhL (DUF1145 family)